MLYNKLKKFKLRKFPPSDIKLGRKEKLIVYSSIVFNLILAIVVGIVISLSSSTSLNFIVLFTYGLIAPITIYLTWIFLSYRKLNKWPQTHNPLGGNKIYLVAFTLLGLSVTGWALFWNTGLDLYWLSVAYVIFQLSKNELATLIVYLVGSGAITPAFTEEFLKSFPSILAFFVVLQRNRVLRQKGKGALGNELVGIIIGIVIGIMFEIIELSLYVLNTIYAGGAFEDVYFQIVVRTIVPIHILGGMMGGYAAGRAERLRFEKGEEGLPFFTQAKMFIKRFLPYWAIPVVIHFLWNSSFVWLVLIFILLKNDDMVLLFIQQIVIMLILTVMCYALIIIFFEKANKSANGMYQCPTTGIYALDKNTPCEAISDNGSQRAEIEASKINMVNAAQQKQCPKCGTLLSINYRFCTNCGIDIWQYVSYLKQKERDSTKYVGRFLKISLFFMIVYTLLVLFFGFVFFADPALQAFYLFMILTPIIIMFGATILLLKGRKKYSGKRSVWGWMLFIFNYVGMMISFILVGIGFLSSSYISYTDGNAGALVVLRAVGIFLLIMGFLILLLFYYFLKKGGAQHMLHYQKYDPPSVR